MTCVKSLEVPNDKSITWSCLDGSFQILELLVAIAHGRQHVSDILVVEVFKNTNE